LKLILNDVSRLRRWLRCKPKSDGFRRNNGDWRVCWDIIDEMPANEKEIPNVNVFKVGNNERFRFEDEPEPSMLAEEDLEMEFRYEDTDVEMLGTDEEEEEEEMVENLHPKLRGVVMGSVKVEP
jgi:hypothetical protein